MLSRMIPISVAVALTAIVGTAPAWSQAAAVEDLRVRGTIDAVNGNTLSITTREGEKVDIILDEGAAITYPVALGMDALVNNAFIGAAAVEGADGKLDAVEVLVFPEAARGFGEGHYPWDLAPNTNMTNATIAAVEPQNQGVLVNVKYPDGEKMILITPDIPVWTFTAGDASLLVPGAYLFSAAARHPDGRITSGLVIVEKDGLRPPN